MPRSVVFLVAFLVVALRSAALLAGLIANGGFQSLVDGRPEHWTCQPGAVRIQNASVISGDHSAEIVRPHGNNLFQAPGKAVSSFEFQMDFAVFSLTGDGDRTMNVLLYSGPGASRIAVNMRVGGGNRLAGARRKLVAEYRKLDGAAHRRCGCGGRLGWRATGGQPVDHRRASCRASALLRCDAERPDGQTRAAVPADRCRPGRRSGECNCRRSMQPATGWPTTCRWFPAPSRRNCLRPTCWRGFLEGPMADVDEIVLAERVTEFDHYYATFGFLSSTVPEYPPQCGIEGEQLAAAVRRRGPAGALPPAHRAAHGAAGRSHRRHPRSSSALRRPDDLFSYRRGGQPYYHLYEDPGRRVRVGATDRRALRRHRAHLSARRRDHVRLEPLQPVRQLLAHAGGRAVPL
jgi:hypothetical protein